MKPIYAIGDIHGQLEGLDEALALVKTDSVTSAKIVFLGDYTDRDKDSRGVIDRLIEGRDVGRDWIFLKGNHDWMSE
jgi:serine/threonine protein phosphatase 1